jgi:hypothetical protein
MINYRDNGPNSNKKKKKREENIMNEREKNNKIEKEVSLCVFTRKRRI